MRPRPHHSTNGTFVNKRQIRGRTRLAAGDIVCFDSSNYYLSLPSSETHTVLVRKLRPSVEGTGRSTIAFEPDDDSSDTMVVQEYPLPGSWPIAKDDRVFPDRASKYPAAQVNLVLDAALPNREGVAAAVVVMGSETSGVIRLEIEHEQQRWSIGRSPEQAICLDDVSISSRHATLTHDNGRWGIRDEGSVNSVLVNDRQRDLSSLADGDVISLGRVDLVFRLLN